MSKRRALIQSMRWVARIWSLLTFAFIGAFVIGELFNSSGPAPTPVEWLGLAFFPIGVLIGLGLGWWREGVGGGTAVLSLLAFYGWGLIVSGRLPGGPFFLLLTAPAFLYLLVWQQTRREAS